jgi:hypothetical protein
MPATRTPLNRRAFLAAFNIATFTILCVARLGGPLIWAQAAGTSPTRAASVRIGPEGGYLKDRGNSRVLVFVHGFANEPDSDFRCDNLHNWPEMIAADADPSLAATDIYVLGYPTPPRRGKTAVAGLETAIVDRLQSAGVFSRHEEVLFVAHAMGGLLIQQIIAANSQADWVHKLRGVFLYGTPQGTGKLAMLGRYIDADPRLKEMEGNGNNFILHPEAPVWTTIPRLCAYETLSDDGFSALDYSRNTAGCADHLAIHANRGNIAQPCRVDDAAYIFLEDKLRAFFPAS